MGADQRFDISLPQDVAEIVEGKVRSGAYGSVSEVVRDGLRALVEKDAALERWLREEVVGGHAEYLADPARAVPADQILGRLQARRLAAKPA